ncbi:MAG: alpha/beta hydrolase [Thermoplasmataceae archaeon]
MQRSEIHTDLGRISYLHRDGTTPIIFLHGLGGSGNNWIKLEQYLDGRFDLYMPDLAGQGRTRIVNYDHTVEMQCRVIRSFADSIGIRRPALVGNSYGGWVALRLVLSGMPVSRLFLVDSAGINRTGGEGTPESREAFVDRIMHMNPGNSRECIRKMILNNATGREKITTAELESISVPTAIIWGSEDSIIPLEYANQFHSLIGGSDLEIIHGAGHTPQTSNPAELAGIISRLMQESSTQV